MWTAGTVKSQHAACRAGHPAAMPPLRCTMAIEPDPCKPCAALRQQRMGTAGRQSNTVLRQQAQQVQARRRHPLCHGWAADQSPAAAEPTLSRPDSGAQSHHNKKTKCLHSNHGLAGRGASPEELAHVGVLRRSALHPGVQQCESHVQAGGDLVARCLVRASHIGHLCSHAALAEGSGFGVQGLGFRAC